MILLSYASAAFAAIHTILKKIRIFVKRGNGEIRRMERGKSVGRRSARSNEPGGEAASPFSSSQV
jgi:hypothetical protein